MTEGMARSVARTPAPAAGPSPAPRRLWRTPLLVGICFGLGYGLTQRLLALQLPGLVQLGQGFDVRPFPGTSLESLRQTFGAEGQAIRGDLDLMELEAENQAAEERARQQAEEEARRLAAPEQPLETQLPPEARAQPEPVAPAPPPPDLPQFSADPGQR